MKKLFLWLLAAILLIPATGTAASAGSRFSMSYIYFGNSSEYTSLVDKTKNSLHEVAPNYFTLHPDGSLMLTNAVSTDFVKDMHDREIRVVPYLSNHWVKETGINALLKREALAESLAKAVSAYNLDGVNIDLENLDENQRDVYVDFVRLLRKKLPQDKTIAVAAAANPWGKTKGWQGSYDYARLAQYSDYLMIMAYDEHYNGSSPGSVASISFMEKSVVYALSQTTGDKIVLGLPFYGRMWADNGGYPMGYGVSNSRIARLVADYSGTVSVDKATMSAAAKITVRPDDIKPVIGGSALAAGDYTIWYENDKTLKEKLGLVHKYNLKGAGSWSLGQEEAGTWDYYTAYLNGFPFGDIAQNWARDYIYTAYQKGWVNGTAPGVFSPDAPLTRAQAVALLMRALGYPVERNTEFGFSDTSGSWASDYINTARRYGLVSGVGGNNYAPERKITRQEVALLFVNAVGYNQDIPQIPFSDVSQTSNPWSYNAIASLSARGIITGFPDGTFRPYANISRAEMTALLLRLFSD